MKASLHLLLPAGLIAASALLAGCDRVGSPFEALGRRVPPPDEFAVVKRKPLVMPPALGLPEPRPGAPSPLDPRPRQEAALALLGNPAAAAGPASGRPMTSSEAALLESADAAAASDEVRARLARDGETEEDGPYRPPTIFELFGMAEPPAIDPAERLEPVTEAQRLQRTGVPAPADPLARPAADPEPQAEAEAEGEQGVRVFTAPRSTGRP